MPQADAAMLRSSSGAALGPPRQSLRGSLANLPEIKVVQRRGAIPSCRCCGFPLGRGDLALASLYGWPASDHVTRVWLRLDPCRYGAAHALTRGQRSATGARLGLDEPEEAVLAQWSRGLRIAQIARTVGTSESSIE